MAKQVSAIKITGTLGDVTFYQINGKYYAKMKTSISRHKLKTHPHYERFRKCSAIMGRASTLSSELYRKFPKHLKFNGMFGKLCGEVFQKLRKGISENEVKGMMEQKYVGASKNLILKTNTEEHFYEGVVLCKQKDVKGKGKNSNLKISKYGRFYRGRISNREAKEQRTRRLRARRMPYRLGIVKNGIRLSSTIEIKKQKEILKL